MHLFLLTAISNQSATLKESKRKTSEQRRRFSINVVAIFCSQTLDRFAFAFIEQLYSCQTNPEKEKEKSNILNYGQIQF